MYYLNGFVCGGTLQNDIRIVDVKPLPDKILLIRFNNGERRVFDATILDGPAFKALENDEVFYNPVIEHGIVTWNDGAIDCAPEYMYRHSYDYAEVI